MKLLKNEIVVDNFAGGGGASTGIEAAIGRSVDIAINHSPEAVTMHRANHPETRHYLEDVWDVDPIEATQGRPVGLLWASPDCKHFSRAKGGKPRSKKIRGLAWIVTRWAKAVRPRVIMLENVTEFQTWGPLDADGKPIKSRAGETFRKWVASLTTLGYAVEWRTIIAADHGTPTTRKRLFLIARCDGKPIEWPAESHTAETYIPAASCIDWSIPAPSIIGRPRPLADRTLARIARGVERYVVRSADPFIIPLTHHGAPLRTVTGANRADVALIAPLLIQTGYGERKGQAPRTLDIGAPLGTVVAGGAKHAVALAWLTKNYTGVTGSSLRAPVGTVTAKDHHSLTTATLTPTESVRGRIRRALVSSIVQRFNAHHTPMTVTLNGVRYAIADIGFRMLQPRELFNAQGFDRDYRIDVEHNGKPLTKTAKIHLAGNSVCPPVARALVEAA